MFLSDYKIGQRDSGRTPRRAFILITLPSSRITLTIPNHGKQGLPTFLGDLPVEIPGLGIEQLGNNTFI